MAPAELDVRGASAQYEISQPETPVPKGAAVSVTLPWLHWLPEFNFLRIEAAEPVLDAKGKFMTPEEVALNEALVDYEQSDERVGLEHRNWSYLQMSYNSFMQSLQAMGLSREEAQGRFDSRMSSHADSFSLALENRNSASSRLVEVLRKFPSLIQHLPSGPKRRLGL